MRDRTRPSLRMLAAPAATGTAAALLFLGAWMWASGPQVAALLLGTANALGALMLALSALFNCAAFATSLALDGRTPGRGVAAPCTGRDRHGWKPVLRPIARLTSLRRAASA
jgi:hypothetical protein